MFVLIFVEQLTILQFFSSFRLFLIGNLR